MLYPLQLQPIFKLRLWGGHKLEELFGLKLPFKQNVGELWAIADHGSDSNCIINGPLAGQTLGQIRETYPLELMGINTNARHFPLLVKVLDAQQKLSVQVHPDDTYATCHERNDKGKNEFWYVIDSQPGAEIVYGLKPGIATAQLSKAVQQHSLEHVVNLVKVKPGDTFYIPAGLVHSLGAGIMVAEVQQNSDLTYRLYDYGRLDNSGLPRQLHVEKAVAVTNCDLHPTKSDLTNPFEGDYFSVYLLKIRGFSLIHNREGKLRTWFILRGAGRVCGGGEAVDVKAGDALVLPASLVTIKTTGFLSILSSNPNNAKL